MSASPRTAALDSPPLDDQPGHRHSHRRTGPAPAHQRQAHATTRIVATHRHRRYRPRRRATAIVAALATLATLLATATGVWLSLWDGDRGSTTSGSTTSPAPAAPPAHVPQQVLLLEVRAGDGTSLDDVLLGVSPGTPERSAEGVMMLVPGRLLVDVAGAGTVSLSEAAAMEPGQAGDALSDLLGLRVDGTWTLETTALAALVDAVGGVDATVDVDVLAATEGGTSEVVLAEGAQHLDGEAAAAWATYLATGEADTARLARFKTVLEAVFAGLPDDPADVLRLLIRLDTASVSTVSTRDLAAALDALHTAVTDGDMSFAVLPVTPLDGGGDDLRYGVDATLSAQALARAFPDAASDPGDTTRVLVSNGVGTPGLVAAARERLVADGFRFIDGGNAAVRDQPTSTILIPLGADRANGDAVARALGLPREAVQTSVRGQGTAEVLVLLGADFAP